jgi:hypothetical protein
MNAIATADATSDATEFADLRDLSPDALAAQSADLVARFARRGGIEQAPVPVAAFNSRIS